MAEWGFTKLFVPRELGSRGAKRGIRRLKFASQELRTTASIDPVLAAEGVLDLVERIGPAFDRVDPGAYDLDDAVTRTLLELIPVFRAAPVDRETREQWLIKLWGLLQLDDFGYLDPIEKQWGEWCTSPDIASQWADRLIDRVRSIWTSSGHLDDFDPAICGCLSCLLHSGRYNELWELLDLAPFPFWNHRQYGFRAHVNEGNIEAALAYAAAVTSRRPAPDADLACEQLLIANGMEEAAYAKYGFTVSARLISGLEAYRVMSRKYPSIPPKRILSDLAARARDCGSYFAAAVEAKEYDLALHFAVAGAPDPAVLSDVCENEMCKNTRFAHAIGQIAMQRYLDGQGLQVSPWDWASCYRRYASASQRLGEDPRALAWVEELAQSAMQRRESAPMASRLIRWIREGV